VVWSIACGGPIDCSLLLFLFLCGTSEEARECLSACPGVELL